MLWLEEQSTHVTVRGAIEYTPLQLINPGEEGVKLHRGTRVGTLDHVLMLKAEYPVGTNNGYNKFMNKVDEIRL